MMHFVTLKVCAYMLLLSSVVTIVILLRKQFQKWMTTSLYILSVSDALFSILTSSILFLNCVQHITYTNYNKLNNTCSIIDNISNNNGNQSIKLNKVMGHFNTIKDEDSFNVIQKCNITSIMIRYGILFLPLTNAFISLLVFSIQCHLNVCKCRDQWFQLLQSQDKIYEDSITTNTLKIETQSDSVLKLLKTRRIFTLRLNIHKLLHVFKYNNLKENKKITVLFIITQWIVPVFVTGLLYLNNYEKNYIKGMDNTKCLYESMFFLGECHNSSYPMKFLQNASCELDMPFEYKDYINSEDPIHQEILNSTQLNEIISKVQNIVYSTMNNTFTLPFNTISFNTSTPWNLTKNLRHNTAENNTRQYKNIAKHTSSVIYESTDNRVNINQDIPAQSTLQMDKYIKKYNGELKNNLTMNYSRDKIGKQKQTNEIIQNITEKLHFKDVEADIFPYIGFIYGLTNHTINYNKSSNIYNNKKSKGFDLNADYRHNISLDMQKEIIKMIIYENDNSSYSVQIYTTNKCFMTTEFLKLYVLGLVFIIYFFPILLALMLHQYGRSNCQIILEKLKASNKVQLNNMDSYLKRDVHEPSTSNQINEYSNKDISKSIVFDKSQKNEEQYEIHNEHWNKSSKNTQHSDISFTKEKMQLNMLNEMKEMLKLFDIIKISLISGILLWTPLLLEFLINVFTLLHILDWLISITYLAAITFSVIRNKLNLEMIKHQKINTGIAKTNSIHPIDDI